ncbi:hypothetical protein Y032_0055g2606 [Ancylostoma ceylanicum]|uniref:Uncharacterized protein n=1 Tax=Ancylostoma ceylanicum TaxID=53326 RepID=A0A016U6L5_9BILA|nr:hypothetical protein Y032_0055g2606 [Ancylostoma ceylanicum]
MSVDEDDGLTEALPRALYSTCRKNRRIARAVSWCRGCRIAAGPTPPSRLEHALSASLVQVPPRFCRH